MVMAPTHGRSASCSAGGLCIGPVHIKTMAGTGPPGRERAHTMYAGLQELRLGGALLPKLRRAPRLPPPPHPPQPACPRPPPPPASPPLRYGCACDSRGRVGGARPASHAIRFGASPDRTLRRGHHHTAPPAGCTT